MAERSKRLTHSLSLVALAAVLGGVWLVARPPELTRVATGFAAKTVCSQVFIAGRPALRVLREDVQAPGHPLLRAVRVSVDLSGGVVRASLLGLWSPARAVYREGIGCAVIHATDDRPGAVLVGGGTPRALAFAKKPRVQVILDDDEQVGPGFRAAVVLVGDELVAERYAPGFTADTPLGGWSMTKTVNAILVGTLMARGLLTLDEADLFPDWWDDERTKITVADLLAMESGLTWDEAYGTVSDVNRMLFLTDDMAALAGSSRRSGEDHPEFSYASGSSVLLSRIWQRRLEDPELAAQWPTQALFSPLGLSHAIMEMDAAGTFVGSSFMMASARDWAKLGQFLAADGRVDGELLVPEGFVSWMRSHSGASSGQYGRGQLWRQGPGGTSSNEGLPEDTFWLLGHDGQSVAVVPHRSLVVVRMGLTPERLGYRPEGLLRNILGALDAGQDLD